MQTYTVEVSWTVPEYVHITVEANTPIEAMDKALARVAENPDQFQRKLDYESCGPDLVTGLWEGDRAYPSDSAKALPLPATRQDELERAIEAAVEHVRQGWAASVELRALLTAFDRWKQAR